MDYGNETFQAGVARCDITPVVGIAHGNWSAQVHERAEGVDLPLWCTVLAASDGKEQVLIVEWDLLYPHKGDELAALRDRITRLTGVPASHIRISASHTHSGPSLTKPWFDAGAELIGPYLESLADKVAAACLSAHGSMKPARIAGGKGSSLVNLNRRRLWKSERTIIAPNPDGYSDHDVGVIRVDDLEGRPIAVIGHFSAHPTILAWDNRLISPDYPGTVRRTVEGIMNTTCMFLQGSTGDQDTVRDFSCRPEDARWVGRQIGIEVARVAELVETRPTRLDIGETVESSWTMGRVERLPNGKPDGRVRCLSRMVSLPIWTREEPTAAELQRHEELRRQLASLREQGAPEDQVREANRLVRRADLELFIARQRCNGVRMETEFQGIRLGNTALVGIPVEPFAELGAEVKRRSPAPFTLFSGYTNGYTGYLPTAAAYPEGGYEIWATPFAPEAGALAVEESLALIRELWA